MGAGQLQPPPQPTLAAARSPRPRLLRACARYGAPATRAPAQAFLCLGWHVEWMLEATVQAAMLAVVMQDNEAICSMPVSASGQGSGWHGCVGDAQACLLLK